MDREKAHIQLLVAIACILAAACIGYSVLFVPPISDPAAVTTTDTPSATLQTAFNGKIHLNSAPQSQLETLKGVGPALAKRIIAYREEHGGFVAVEQLLEVKGIGEALYREIEPYVDL